MMFRVRLLKLLLALLAASLLFSKTPAPLSSSGRALLFGRAWKIVEAPFRPALGSMYIFLANGTLLMTSCTETYRIATWTTDARSRNVLHLVEDGNPSATLTIRDLNATSLHLTQTLVRQESTLAYTLSPVEKEFVCPDLPK